ncbi:MAG TPA: hypothetical protein VD994_08390, partial [Prosthecobacter sp.]|nr:hypothetical protein [Prosthecobacter sp.]
FAAQTAAWKSACTQAGVALQVIGESDGSGDEDLKHLELALREAAAKPHGQLWLVWIGHGTFDGREAKFNLRGPDVSVKSVVEWLKPSQRELVIIQTASASAPFLTSLAGPKRIIVSSTKGADEVFYARFGEFFAPAIAGLAEADLDQDQQVSVLEAFLHASRKTAEFYEEEGRLATEHALIEDNGDGVGTRAEIFTGVTANPPEGTKADGTRASQIALVLSAEEAALPDAVRARRDSLETKLEQLKASRVKLGEDAYYAEVEKLLRELSALYANPSSS